MELGCSECVCVAIESHSTALLRALLDRPDVAFRDMFWVQSALSYQKSDLKYANSYSYFPILHDLQCLSFYDYELCKHEQIDVELREPLLVNTGRILVSLRQLARWHSSEQFPAEQMLRDSDKFDFSEPHFFHMFQRTAHSYGSPTFGGQWRRAPHIRSLMCPLESRLALYLTKELVALPRSLQDFRCCISFWIWIPIRAIGLFKCTTCSDLYCCSTASAYLLTKRWMA